MEKKAKHYNKVDEFSDKNDFDTELFAEDCENFLNNLNNDEIIEYRESITRSQNNYRTEIKQNKELEIDKLRNMGKNAIEGAIIARELKMRKEQNNKD